MAREMGMIRIDKGDYDTAFKYLTKAAELGDAGSHLIYLLCMMKV